MKKASRSDTILLPDSGRLCVCTPCAVLQLGKRVTSLSESTHSPPPCIIHPHIHCKLLIVIITKTNQPCSLTTPIAATPSSKSTHPHSLPKPIETNQNKSSIQRLKLKHERESKDNVYSISALVAGDTFRYNRESPRAARVSSRTLLAKPLFAPAVEQLAFVLPLF